MSINLVLMQLPYVGEMTGAMQGQPEAQQALASEHTQELQRKQQGQVQKVEKEDKSKGVNPDGGQAQQEASPRQRRQRRKEEQPEEELPLNTKDDPWAGHILNKRI